MERLTIRSDICCEPENNIVYSNPNDPEGMYNILDLAKCLYNGGEAEAGILLDISNRLAAYEDSGLSPEEITEKIVDLENKISDLKATLEIYRGFDGCRLNQLIDADMDGRLVVLPCKVGDTVYYTLCGRIFPVTVKQFRKNALQEWKVVIAFDSNYKEILDCVDFGKTVFLTREEAEKALGGGE